MDIFLVQSISELTLVGIPPDGLTLDDDCIIRTMTPEIGSVAHAMTPHIGLINYSSVVAAGAVCFLAQHSPTPLTEEEARRLLLRAITLTQQFLLSLWLVKDNSGNCGEAHLSLLDHDREDVAVYSQRVPFLNYTADCERTTVAFTREEVEKAVDYYRHLEALLPTLEWRSTEPRPSGLVIKSRLYRAIYSAQIARASAEIGVKISFYCIAFEALFSTAREAISHQIAERAAILIESDGAARAAFYHDLKKIYGIRSAVVHGDALSAAKHSEFRKIATTIDDRLRTTIQRIVAEASLLELFTAKPSDAIETYFLDRILAASAPNPTCGSEALPDEDRGN